MQQPQGFEANSLCGAGREPRREAHREDGEPHRHFLRLAGTFETARRILHGRFSRRMTTERLANVLSSISPQSSLAQLHRWSCRVANHFGQQQHQVNLFSMPENW
jgi:hypothetical protein